MKIIILPLEVTEPVSEILISGVGVAGSIGVLTFEKDGEITESLALEELDSIVTTVLVLEVEGTILKLVSILII
jgi:hypothetical protein